MADVPSHTTGRLETTPHRSGPEEVRREIAVLLAGATVYFGGRVIVQGSEARATRNAERLIEFERAIGIDVEASIQDFTLDHGWFETLSNLSYVWLHWPLLLSILFVLFRIDRSHYLQLRRALFVSGAIGLFCFAVVPMAPPRFMPGFVGTVSDDARRHFLPYPLSWANRFAAFPSFHVGWTLIACMALASSLRRPERRTLALIPAALVGISVVTTGNHYLVDAIVGAAIALGAYLWFGRRRSAPAVPVLNEDTDAAPTPAGRLMDFATRILLLLGMAVSVVGGIDGAVGGSGDQVTLFVIVGLLQLAVFARQRVSRRNVTLRPDLARWLDDRAQASGEPFDDVLDRSVATFKHGLHVDR